MEDAGWRAATPQWLITYVTWWPLVLRKAEVTRLHTWRAVIPSTNGRQAQCGRRNLAAANCNFKMKVEYSSGLTWGVWTSRRGLESTERKLKWRKSCEICFLFFFRQFLIFFTQRGKKGKHHQTFFFFSFKVPPTAPRHKSISLFTILFLLFLTFHVLWEASTSVSISDNLGRSGNEFSRRQ